MQILHTNIVKKAGQSKGKGDGSKFLTKNRDCPSKSGTIREYDDACI